MRVRAAGASGIIPIAELEVTDVGGSLRVRESRRHHVRCSGPKKPTVHNIDKLVFDRSRHLFVSISVSTPKGVLGPGATEEADGASEIEISVKGKDANLYTKLGGDDDDVEAGRTGSGAQALNLTAGVDSDIDIKVVRRGFVNLNLGDGDDTYLAQGPGFSEASRDLAVFGGPGADTLTGADSLDYLGGGKGDDTLIGADGVFDFLFGGPDDDLIDGGNGMDWGEGATGRDQISLGAGKDLAFAGDHEFDRVDCGQKKDLAVIDTHRDAVNSCEVINPDERDIEGFLIGGSRRHASRAADARHFFKHAG